MPDENRYRGKLARGTEGNYEEVSGETKMRYRGYLTESTSVQYPSVSRAINSPRGKKRLGVSRMTQLVYSTDPKHTMPYGLWGPQQGW